MAIRTLSFNVSASDSPTQNEPVWAGMQFEDNATEVVFCPDAELVNAVGDSALFRIDFNSPAGYSPSSNLTADQNGNYRRSIPYSMTFIGGELEAVFVVTSADGNLELLSFPVTLYLTEVKRDAICADELHKGLSTVEESVRQLSLIAEESADKAEESADKSQKSAEAAEAALAQTEESVQRFEEAAEAKADLQFKKIEGEFWAYNGITEGSQTSILESIEPSDMVGSEEIYLYFSNGICIGTYIDTNKFSIGSKYVISKSSGDSVIVDSVTQIIDLYDKVDVADIDQTYNPESQNAQSGIAVAEALANFSGGGSKGTLATIANITTTEEVNSVILADADSFADIGKVQDFYVYMEIPKHDTRTVGDLKLRINGHCCGDFDSFDAGYEYICNNKFFSVNILSVGRFNFYQNKFSANGDAALTVQTTSTVIDDEITNVSISLTNANSVLPIGTKFKMVGWVE